MHPGIVEHSNVKILGMSGSSTSVKVDLQVHESLVAAVGPRSRSLLRPGPQSAAMPAISTL